MTAKTHTDPNAKTDSPSRPACARNVAQIEHALIESLLATAISDSTESSESIARNKENQVNSKGDPSDAIVFQAVENDDTEALALYLSSHSACDARDDLGRTPLMIAALRGHQKSYDQLLRAGAALDTTDNAGVPAIEYLHAFGAASTDHLRSLHAVMIKSIMIGNTKGASDAAEDPITKKPNS